MPLRTAIPNRLLASISAKELLRLKPRLEPVSLTLGQVLYEPGGVIRHVYFPSDCLISLLTAVDKTRSLEVGMVGNEGMIGMPFVFGMEKSAVRALVQGAGAAMRMTVGHFGSAFKAHPDLQRALYRYTYALMAQISQTAACNRFHGSEARLARWLLMTRDRVGSEEFALTQDFLAHMLGLRRVGVTEAATALKQKNLIAYSRGTIRIVDSRGLEKASCTCYRIVKAVYARAQE